MFTFIGISRRNIRLQEHSSDCLLYQIKGEGNAGDCISEVQSVLCEEALCLKRVIVV